MIPETSYSPAKAFISFAREFSEALAQEDFQAALSGLDLSSKRWSPEDLVAQLNVVIDSERICSAAGFSQSASPELEQTESGFILRHRLPAESKREKAKEVFEFTQEPGADYFRGSPRGFEPLQVHQSDSPSASRLCRTFGPRDTHGSTP